MPAQILLSKLDQFVQNVIDKAHRGAFAAHRENGVIIPEEMDIEFTVNVIDDIGGGGLNAIDRVSTTLNSGRANSSTDGAMTETTVATPEGTRTTIQTAGASVDTATDAASTNSKTDQQQVRFGQDGLDVAITTYVYIEV